MCNTSNIIWFYSGFGIGSRRPHLPRRQSLLAQMGLLTHLYSDIRAHDTFRIPSTVKQYHPHSILRHPTVLEEVNDRTTLF